MAKVVTCDACQKDFMILIQEKKHGIDIEETYFTCSHCNHRYSVTATNGVIRDRIDKFANEWAKMAKLREGKEWNKKAWMKKYEKLQKYKVGTNRMIDKLKEQIASN